MSRTLILLFIFIWPASAVAKDAGVAIDARANVPKLKRRTTTVDFENDNDGPSAGDEIKTRNPDTVKHGSLFPDKYKRPPGGKADANKRGRGCAGCGGTDQTSAAALILLMIAFAVRRGR